MEITNYNLFDEEQFRRVYFEFMSYLYSCNKNETQYRLARKEVALKFNAIGQYNNFGSDVVDDLLRRDKFAWVNERPPLNWYAAALSALNLEMNFSAVSACELAKASNYYGDFELSKKMSMYAKEKACNSKDEIFFQSTKQLSKAYKNEGDFENSRVILRRAFSEFSNNDESGKIAYLYLLFAKLCNDYQQKQGWHEEFHKIAFERMEKSLDAPEKWKEISAESYAKSISDTNINEANEIYSKLLNNSSMNSDIYVRRASHLCEINILNNLKYSNNTEPNKLLLSFEKHLEECWRIINISEKLGNYKAEIVRKGHLLRLVRKIELWRRSIPALKETQIDIIDDFILGEAMAVADHALKIAYVLNDWRSTATLEFEKGMWLKYIISGTSHLDLNSCQLKAIDHFHRALSTLKKPKQTLTFLYHLVLMELGTSYAINREWYNAAQVLKECYQHCKQLVNNLHADEKLVQHYPTGNSSDFELAELSLLTKVERDKLSKALIEDYKVLTSRLMKVGEQLSDISLEQITKWTAHLYSTSWRSRHHNLISLINNYRDKISDNSDILNDLNNIYLLVKQWAKEDSEFLKYSSFDIIRETNNIIGSIFYLQKFKSNLLIMNTIGVELQVFFNIEVLRIIAENLISNTYEAAMRLTRRTCEWQAKIEFKVINNYVSILYGDNVGDYNNYSNVIDCINNYELPRSSKDRNHGDGLILIKKLIRDFGKHNEKWQLIKDGEWKTLCIPLIKHPK